MQQTNCSPSRSGLLQKKPMINQTSVSSGIQHTLEASIHSKLKARAQLSGARVLTQTLVHTEKAQLDATMQSTSLVMPGASDCSCFEQTPMLVRDPRWQSLGKNKGARGAHLRIACTLIYSPVFFVPVSGCPLTWALWNTADVLCVLASSEHSSQGPKQVPC